MNEWLIYLGLCALALALFGFWLRRNQRRHERRWVLQQSLQDPNNSETLTQALQATQQPKSGPVVLLVALLIIPAALVLQLTHFHSPKAINQGPTQAPDLNTAIAQLEAKLAANPNDLEGQLLYARSMMQIKRYAAAVKALEKANELQPNQANILTELAEAVAFQNNTGSFLGTPEPYLIQALQANPNHQKAMWLQGIVHQQKQEYSLAVALWQRLLPQVQSANVRQTIEQQIAQSQAAMGSAEPASAQNATAYQVTVQASPDVMNLPVNGQMRLFVFAKAVNGPPMPIAAFPLAAPFQWPIKITLTDAHSLMAERPLSQFAELSFSAKISPNGSATPSPEDISSDAVIVQRGQTQVNLTLNQ